jgi:hypothetical protein
MPFGAEVLESGETSFTLWAHAAALRGFPVAPLEAWS